MPQLFTYVTLHQGLKGNWWLYQWWWLSWTLQRGWNKAQELKQSSWHQMTFLQDRGWQPRTTVSGVSQEEKKQIWQKHVRKFESTDLKNCDPTWNSSNVFDPWTWDALGDALRDCIRQGSIGLAELLFLQQTVCASPMYHAAPGNWEKREAHGTITATLALQAPTPLVLSCPACSFHATSAQDTRFWPYVSWGYGRRTDPPIHLP